MTNKTKYLPTIGIECHVQLKTATKLFSAVGNDARSAQPNTLISHIDLGMPGALPVLNEKAVEYAVRMAYAVNTEPEAHSLFERKHYFYPDLPKGYQITQLHQPIVKGGTVELDAGEGPVTVRLNRIQIEEDAGKSTHPAGSDYSLVDLNRAGTPLLEIVSEPDMHSALEAKAYAKELYLLVRYADISDADMYHGNMRFDVNVSVSPEGGGLGTRTETKNLNSFRSVEKAVEYEIKRQIELLEKGQPVVQETRGWDDAKQKTLSQRSKEESHDYRYFPEPDLPPIELDKAYMADVKQAMPVMPAEWRKRLKSLGLDTGQTDVLLLAEAEDTAVNYLPLIEARLEQPELAKFMANMFVNVEIPKRREGKTGPAIADERKAAVYVGMYELVRASKLSSTSAKALLAQLLAQGTAPENLEQYAEEQGFSQISDEEEMGDIIDEVIAANPQAADDFRAGAEKAVGFLVGQVMAKSRGKANPQMAKELIMKKLRKDRSHEH